MATTISRTHSSKNSNRRLRAPKKLVLPDSRMTVEQWAELPHVVPPYELINGALIRKMVTTNEHDWTVAEISFQCRAWARNSGWRFFSQGSGTRLDLFNGFIPDVMGFASNVKLDGAATYNPPPFIAFEVISKGTAKADRGDKKRAYESAGVPIYVIVDLKKQVLEIHNLQDGKYSKPEILQSDGVWQPAELPGLKIELAKLWF